MSKLGVRLVKSIREGILPILKQNESEYVIDGVASDLGAIYARLNAFFTGTITLSFAQLTASDIVKKTMLSNKKRFDRTIERAVGVDLGRVLMEENLQDFVDLSVARNVGLITSLPEEYLKSVEVIVTNGITSGKRFSTIAKEIFAKTGSANSKLKGRIKTIARNEVQTINAQVNLRRSSNLGITKGIYRTSRDEKVRPCHDELNGQEYVLSKGAWSKKCQKWIQPGITDINCRCSYSPIIELE